MEHGVRADIQIPLEPPKKYDILPLDLAHMGLIIYGKPWDYISKGLFP
jgi:hypothetical protein